MQRADYRNRYLRRDPTRPAARVEAVLADFRARMKDREVMK